jgi:hypothetical protein
VFVAAEAGARDRNVLDGELVVAAVPALRGGEAEGVRWRAERVVDAVDLVAGGVAHHRAEVADPTIALRCRVSSSVGVAG